MKKKIRTEEREREGANRRELEKRYKDIVDSLELIDSDTGTLTEKGKALKKSANQIKIEARQKLSDTVFDMYTSGVTSDTISTTLGLRSDQVLNLIAERINAITQMYGKEDPADHFAKYAYFHTRQIQKLDALIQAFNDDPESKQYNATVQAIRAQSDFVDKIYRKGNELGVIKQAKTGGEHSLEGKDLLKALIEERDKLDSIVSELEVTIHEKSLKASVKRSPKPKKSLREEFGNWSDRLSPRTGPKKKIVEVTKDTGRKPLKSKEKSDSTDQKLEEALIAERSK